MSTIWRRHLAETVPAHHREELTRNIRPQLDRQAAEERAARKIDGIMRESEPVREAKQLEHVDPGDAALLRGLPVVGVKGGFGGTIRGTRPGDPSGHALAQATAVRTSSRRRPAPIRAAGDPDRHGQTNRPSTGP